MNFSPAVLKSALPPEHSVARFCVALSGGLDSMVLLHAVTSLRLSVPVTALHVNHGISSNADSWQAHCAAFCEILQIPFYAEKVKVTSSGRGLEDSARAARYAVFERYLQQGDILLTAHHADDQAETLLFRLLRGAGPRGLAAMARQRKLGAGKLYRPLLGFNRSDLEAYAHMQQLPWVEDESNADTRYDRNFLRHKIIPLLQQRWPQLVRTFQQTADLCADNEDLLMEMAAADLRVTSLRAERIGQSIRLAAMESWSMARRHNLLRHWLRLQKLDTPEKIHLVQFEEQIMNAREDAEVALSWGNLTLHRYRQRLYVQPRKPRRDEAGLEARLPVWFSLADVNSFVALPDGARLHFEYADAVGGAGYLQTLLPNLSVRWRQGGERCQPESRAHSQTLKRLLQEYGVEPWWRDQLPLIYSGDLLVAVGDLWICKNFVAAQGQPGYRLHWQPGVK